ncbi:DUF4097 family beta strand repeat-containing protein [Chondrinema litorale]|uniref:DUF4097 family beta strand repeat-containing protein n=1 Tax=Chondrinema litorale TaxID=2994555 RepID=UPI0025434378|nr:DUF4097 family beta strand repeat-containing protein [Chondrinema litorale]UZR95771.1 hypothetical protein OQ292_08090 [Chondrinema litorale]
MKSILFMMLLSLASHRILIAQTHSETITRKLSFTSESNNFVVFIENINGSIDISPTNGDEVELEALLEITGEDQQTLEQGKKEVELVSRAKKDTILIFISSPAISYYRHDSRRGFNYDSRKVDYEFKANIKLKVPAKALVDVSTVNKGDVVISEHKGQVKASNVNGSVHLTNVGEVLKAVTVNGDITVSATESPTENASFKTINGDIKVKYPQNLGAELSFKSFNGEFYTDYTIAEYLPVKVSTSQSSKKENVFKLEGTTVVKIGKGGPELKFETLNGDVYVSSKSL